MPRKNGGLKFHNWMFRYIEPTIQYLFGTPINVAAKSILKLVLSDINELQQERRRLLRQDTLDDDWSNVYYNTTEPEMLLPHATDVDGAIWLWNESCHICHVKSSI